MTIDISNDQLKALILSHGWYTLEPFSAEICPPSIMLAFDLPIGTGIFEVTGEGQKSKFKVIKGNFDTCLGVARICLSLDVDINKFHALAIKAGKRWHWMSNGQMGRFLRSPSLFEDCAKALMTTNTTWNRTDAMVQRLVTCYGRSIGHHKAFPSPSIILAQSELQLRKNVGCGFRAKYLLKMASMAAEDSGTFMGTSWMRLGKDDFFRLMISLPGIGEVTANYLALMYSRPFGFNIDAYVRRRCQELWGIPEQEIESFCVKRYGRFGEYAPLALWLELTRHWHLKDWHSSSKAW